LIEGSLYRSSSGNNPEQNHHDGDYQQNMDESAQGCTRYQSEQPQNQ